MIGVICAGGKGTRLYPLTYATNKHLLPVYDRPMIFYPIQTLVKAGVKDIVIVTGGPYASHCMRVLRDGHDFGIQNIHYVYQEESRGIADAIYRAGQYCRGKEIAVLLGDNCTDADISKEVDEFDEGAMVFLKEVPDPERFGVPAFNKHNEIVGIYEKPKEPPSNYAVTGLYLYDATVFDKIETLKPSARGELEVTDLNNLYLKEKKLKWGELRGFWRDAGTFETLFEVNDYWQKKRGGGK